jgi:hypothetical protein
MKNILCLLTLFVIFLNKLDAQEKYILTGDYNNLTFNEFALKAEKEYGVKFFYRQSWVSDIRLKNYPECKTLECLLDNLFKNTNLHYLIEDSGNIVITRNFEIKIAGNPEKETGKFLPPTESAGTREDLQAGNKVIEVGNPAEKNNPGNVTISGYITNKDTGEPVPGVTVVENKLSSGTISNEFGFYSLKIPRGIHALRFTFIGMKEKNININIFSSGSLDVEMNSVLIPLKETIVSARKNITLQRFEVGAEKININTFRIAPTSMGEPDIIKNILLIPGVQSVGEGSAGFNVRGGSADQNLVLLYGAPLYNTSHFFGFFSAVNSDIIKDVTLYKGGIPARYGGRLSSVLDIGAEDGDRKEFKGNAGISPVTTHLKVEGPIKKDTLTYLITARTTYSNYLLRLINNPFIGKSRASFWDINGRITYYANKNNRFDFSSYLSHDDFRFRSDTTYNYNNAILAVSWRHFFTGRFLSTFAVNNSSYSYDITETEFSPEAFSLKHNINSTSAKADFNWFAGNHEMNFGMDMTGYVAEPGKKIPVGDSSLVFSHAIEKQKGLEGALYLDDKFSVTEYLSVNLGVRMSSFLALGPQTVMLYDPDYTKSVPTIIDTLHYSKGSVIRNYGGPEFRISLNFRISDKNSIKINYNKTRQYLHLLSNTSSISPTDTWNLSGYYLKPQTGDQVAFGFYRISSGNRYETSAEMYYKRIRNIVDFKGGANIVMDDNIEKDIVNARGKAYGLELVFKKIEGRFRYSLAYTFSRTFIRSTGKFREEMINDGKPVPASFDRPNDLIASISYFFSRRLNFTANYIWNSGRPITYPVATYIMYDDPLIHYSDRNRYRLPDYSRLDVSLRINSSLLAHRLTHPNWTFSVYNLLGRENVYSVFFRREGDLYTGYKLSVFGSAIPTVSFSFDF